MLLLLFPLLLLGFPSASPLRGQTLGEVNPLETAFAGSVSARSGDPRFAWRNPAALGNTAQKFNIFASYAPSVLGIDGYREGSFIGSLSPAGNLSFGLTATGLGTKAYREFSGGAIVAATVGNNLRLGAALNARSVSIDEYGSRVVPLIDLGAQIQAMERLTLGASFLNATRTAIADEELPQRLALGMAYASDSTFSLSLDVVQELRRDLSFGIGISFSPLRNLTLRTGIASEPGRVGYGVGYRMGDIVVDYGGAYVDPLGFRHLFGVGVAW